MLYFLYIFNKIINYSLNSFIKLVQILITTNLCILNHNVNIIDEIIYKWI